MNNGHVLSAGRKAGSALQAGCRLSALAFHSVFLQSGSYKAASLGAQHRAMRAYFSAAGSNPAAPLNTADVPRDTITGGKGVIASLTESWMGFFDDLSRILERLKQAIWSIVEAVMAAAPGPHWTDNDVAQSSAKKRTGTSRAPRRWAMRFHTAASGA